jgi:hypothetical protein
MLHECPRPVDVTEPSLVQSVLQASEVALARREQPYMELERTMPQSREQLNKSLAPFVWGVPTIPNMPMLAILADFNGTLWESIATAQKEWADFMQRRIREDVAATRQLLSCNSLADMHEVYSKYLRTVFEDYQQHSQKVVKRGQSMAQHLAETVEASGKEATRARH